jgi:hypothetical protein
LDDIHSPRKRPAADHGSHFEDVNRTKRPAKESDIASVASSGGGGGLFQPQPLAPTGKPAAVTPPASDGSHRNSTVTRERTTGAPQDVARPSNAETTSVQSSNGMNRCVPLIPTPATCSR